MSHASLCFFRKRGDGGGCEGSERNIINNFSVTKNEEGKKKKGRENRGEEGDGGRVRKNINNFSVMKEWRQEERETGRKREKMKRRRRKKENMKIKSNIHIYKQIYTSTNSII